MTYLEDMSNKGCFKMSSTQFEKTSCLKENETDQRPI